MPIASVLLIVGAGGGFGRVLEQAGVGQAIAVAASGLHVPTLLLRGSSPGCCAWPSARPPWPPRPRRA